MSNKKVMDAVFFRITGLVRANKLEGQKTVTANLYTASLPESLQKINVREVMLHHNNAYSHSSPPDLKLNFLNNKKLK